MDVVIVKNNSILYSYKGGLKTALCCDLVAIESDKPFVGLVFNSDRVLVRASLSMIETQLPDCFMKVNRQAIVNMRYVSELLLKTGSYWLLLSNGMKYRISERREKVFRTAYLQFMA